MKKYKILLCLLLFPITIFAYSDKIIPGGDNLGIKINIDGIMIVGFYKVENAKSNKDLMVGDVIRKVNEIEVYSINDFTSAISKIDSEVVNLEIKRKNKNIILEYNLYKENGVYKTGLYVKDSMTGIGTLSYIDPETLIYGALGHEVLESNSNEKVEIKTGDIFKSLVTSIEKSSVGSPGGKNAKFFYNSIYGSIIKNTNVGIYGKYTYELPKRDTLEVSKNITNGKAYIYTVLKDNNIEQYEINILNIKNNAKTKNIYFEITDKTLLNRTGGVIQGMSGSPIIQNNKIVGAVTHVIVSEPIRGYGIFITTMLEEGEKVN